MLHRITDPETSRISAALVAPKLKKLQAAVLRYAQGRKLGFTDLDLTDHFNSTASTYRSRRAELVNLGLIESTGKTTVQKGRPHTVWRCTKEGFDVQIDPA